MVLMGVEDKLMMGVRECLFIVYMRIPYKCYQELEDFSSFH